MQINKKLRDAWLEFEANCASFWVDVDCCLLYFLAFKVINDKQTLAYFI